MTTLTKKLGLFLLAVMGLLLIGCGGSDSSSGSESEMTESSDSGLSAEQLENGIGPITSVTVGEIDAELVAAGEKEFTMKCAACHKMDTRYVGPPLGGVTQNRTPEFIMNMMLNPDQMVKEHPEGQSMLATYMTPMPNQNLTEEAARAVLEYLRTQEAPE